MQIIVENSLKKEKNFAYLFITLIPCLVITVKDDEGDIAMVSFLWFLILFKIDEKVDLIRYFRKKKLTFLRKLRFNKVLAR
tara:strand:+ start:527 stop:769 length:243 start_codon:yes stop_codon:yes gene_type:complete